MTTTSGTYRLGDGARGDACPSYGPGDCPTPTVPGTDAGTTTTVGVPPRLADTGGDPFPAVSVAAALVAVGVAAVLGARARAR